MIFLPNWFFLFLIGFNSVFLLLLVILIFILIKNIFPILKYII